MVLLASVSRRKRLARRLVMICQFACDMGELEIAGQLLRASEFILDDTALDAGGRHEIARMIVGAHHRLYELRHADGGRAMAGGGVVSETPGS